MGAESRFLCPIVERVTRLCVTAWPPRPALIKISRGHFNIKQQNIGQSKSSSIIPAPHPMTNDKIGLKIQMIARLPHTTHNTTRSQIRGERSYKEKTVVMMGTRAQGTLGEHSTGDNCHVSRESDFNMQIHGPCSSHRMVIGDMEIQSCQC